MDPPRRAAHFLQLVLRLRSRCCRPVVAHPPARDSAGAGRPLRQFFDYTQDNPTAPFAVFNRDGRRVVDSGGPIRLVPAGVRVPAQPERARDVDRASASASTTTATSRASSSPANTASRRRPRPASAGRGRTSSCPTALRERPRADQGELLVHDADEPLGAAAVQRADGAFSSNVRLALLNRSGTGLFVVYNDRRDTLSSTPIETLGPLVRREVHAALRLLEPAGRLRGQTRRAARSGRR